jgi:hypothetical protein
LQPQDGGCDDQFGTEIGGLFGVAGGEVAELFEPVEAALDENCLREAQG